MAQRSARTYPSLQQGGSISSTSWAARATRGWTDMTVREPVLTTVAILDLRPTQITVGMREVEAKRKRWSEIRDEKGGKFLGKHMVPVVLGPKHRNYVVDHHHL